MITIAIIIPIHNRLATTQAGLAVLEKSLTDYYLTEDKKIKYQTIVVDDGSTDGSAEWIAEHHPSVIVLKGDGNLWWTGAINVGVLHALNTLKADYILLWNDDIAPADNFFTIAEENLQHFDQQTVFGANIVDSNPPHKVLSCGGFFNKLTGIETIINQSNFERYAKSRYIEVDSLTGMGTYIYKDIITNAGMWDEKLPHYKSDSDYTLVLKAKGYRIVADTKLIIQDDATKRGVSKPKTVNEFFKNLKSIRSPYNLKFLTRYHGKHGYAPLSYYGMLKQVIPVFLGVVKRTVLNRKSS